jgi:hypothetical protein
VARAAAFGSKVVVLDEPTAALGVRESNQVLELIRNLRDRGIPVILISHNMPHVFDVADRIHIQRLGKRAATITPRVALDDRRRRDHDGGRARMSWASEEGRVELIARFTALPGREEEVARLLLALTAKVREEPGCLAFEPHRVGRSGGSAVSAGPSRSAPASWSSRRTATRRRSPHTSPRRTARRSTRRSGR